MKLNLDNPLVAETVTEDLDILQTYANEIDVWNTFLVPGLTGIVLSYHVEHGWLSSLQWAIALTFLLKGVLTIILLILCNAFKDYKQVWCNGRLVLCLSVVAFIVLPVLLIIMCIGSYIADV